MINQTQKIILLGGLISLLGFLTLTQRGREWASEIGGAIVNVSESGLNLIKQFEGFSAKPYQDASGYSIGYGHYLGTSPTMSSITVAEAENFLLKDTAQAQNVINKYVKVPLTQNQYDALTSFIYNVGINAFISSTLLKRLNLGDYQGAADQFLAWTKATIGGVKKELPALVSRREAERQIFLS